MGIAEQSASAAAAGLAKEGKLPVFGTYGTFAAARNLDQIRVSLCLREFQRDDRGRPWRRQRWPGRRNAPGAGRPLRHVRPAEHERRSTVRLGGDEEGDN